MMKYYNIGFFLNLIVLSFRLILYNQSQFELVKRNHICKLSLQKVDCFL